MEGLTAEQKAFRVRKLKTRFNALDINGDGFVSAEDYDRGISQEVYRIR